MSSHRCFSQTVVLASRTFNPSCASLRELLRRAKDRRDVISYEEKREVYDGTTAPTDDSLFTIPELRLVQVIVKSSRLPLSRAFTLGIAGQNLTTVSGPPSM